jgi:malonate-semialdehyde dehydrogenase (acetylating)/methylmalonate-semialdehyde dehydrogenase
MAASVTFRAPAYHVQVLPHSRPLFVLFQFFFRYQALIREHQEELAAIITKEQGKTLADARGDVFRGLEVVETTCGAANHLMGETLENVSKGMDTYSYKVPLGVCAGIAPFNFPAMIPLWMFPVGIIAGNSPSAPLLDALHSTYASTHEQATLTC